MSAIQGVLEFLEANEATDHRSESELTSFLDQLKQKLSLVSTEVVGLPEDATTVLYSGLISGSYSDPDRFSAEDAVKGLDGGDLRTINKTDMFALLTLDDFQTKLENALGPASPQTKQLSRKVLDGVNLAGDTRISNYSLWDFASDKFARGAKGDVRFIGPNADPTRVFGATELKALMKREKVSDLFSEQSQ